MITKIKSYTATMSYTLYLTLIRHGQTVENKLKTIQGQSDAKLSEEGIQQTSQLAQHFDINQYDYVFSSDLSRALDTCKAIVGDKKPIITDKLLRERGFGPLEGKPIEYLKQEAKKNGVNLTEFTPEGGETLQQVYQRVKAFVNEKLIGCVKPSSRVVVVTHGGVIREFIRYLAKELKCDFNNLRPFEITPNTAVNQFKLNLRDNKIISSECLKLHDISHLSGKYKLSAINEEQINDNQAV